MLAKLAVSSLILSLASCAPGTSKSSTHDRDMTCIAAISNAMTRVPNSQSLQMIGAYYMGRVDATSAGWGEELTRYARRPEVIGDRLGDTARTCSDTANDEIQRGFTVALDDAGDRAASQN